MLRGQHSPSSALSGVQFGPAPGPGEGITSTGGDGQIRPLRLAHVCPPSAQTSEQKVWVRETAAQTVSGMLAAKLDKEVGGLELGKIGTL